LTLKSDSVRELFETLTADLMIVVAYGLILPADLLQIPRFGCWNIHASLLPRWRGAAPIQRAIENGDRESGVCIMRMDEGLDTGPVLHRVRTPLDAYETGGSLHDRLAELGASALLECLKTLAATGRIKAEPQLASGVSYARKLNKSEAEVDWLEPAEVLERRIRAFNPWPVAWCMIGDERTRIWKSRVVNEPHDSEPGRVLAAGRNGIDIATGQKILRLLELQRPGKNRMSVADYLNARELPQSLAVRS
jgi:methionyl-tRNA formyltransferase